MAKDRGKIRGFYFEIDGADETLQEGLKNFGAALGRALGGPNRPARPALPYPAHAEDGRPSENGAPDEVDEDFDDEFEGDSSKSPKKAGQRRPAKMPQVLELDLEGSDISFKDYALQKKPESINDRFLVVAAWFSQHGGFEEITSDHVFTRFKIMNWSPHPGSYYQIFQDLKRKQHKIDKGSKAGTFKINLVGLNSVNKMGRN